MTDQQFTATGPATVGFLTEGSPLQPPRFESGANIAGQNAGLLARCEGTGAGVSGSSVGGNGGEFAGVFGVIGRGTTKAGISGTSTSGNGGEFGGTFGIIAKGTTGAGVAGTSVDTYGGEFTGTSGVLGRGTTGSGVVGRRVVLQLRGTACW